MTLKEAIMVVNRFINASILTAVALFAPGANSQTGDQVLEKQPQRVYEMEIYRDSKGVRYSTLVKVKFQEEVFGSVVKTEMIDWSIATFRSHAARTAFEATQRRYGSFKVGFRYPDYTYGRNLRWNKRKKAYVEVPDMSQCFSLYFDKPVAVDSLVAFLQTQPGVAFASGPMVAELLVVPDDPYCSEANQWYLYRINAPSAWEITAGRPEIRIDINDEWDPTERLRHVDIGSKFVQEYGYPGSYGGHGTTVAGVAGALTNNNVGIASLGWNLSLTKSALLLPSQILAAANAGVDVINMSWRIFYDDPNLRDAVRTALLQGVVCVAAASNTITPPNDPHPVVVYPAAYCFGGDTGQVIAVSGTRLNPFPTGPEEFCTYTDAEGTHWYNFSPGTDPINDPENSFVDVAAPAAEITTTIGHDEYDLNHIWGTSVAAPQVSALAGLILSLNSSLTPLQVYHIITHTADKIGQFPYDQNGWNRYLGYGRINAYEALRYTSDNYLPLSPPVLASPASGATNVSTSPTLTWNASTGATSYRLQVSTNTSFSPTVFNQTGIAGTSHAASGLANNTTYYWRVNATNSGGTSVWSSTWSFTTIPPPPPAPTLSEPSNGAIHIYTSLTFHWNASTWATSYDLQISTSQSFTSYWLDQPGIGSTSSVVTGLSYGTTYYWRVNATGVGGTSSWSAVWSFTTETPSPPAAPTLLLPPNGGIYVSTSPLLTWNASSGATSYRLQVSTSSAFSTTLVDQNNITATSYRVSGLAISTTYYWRVNAANAGGSSAWSVVWSFVTSASGLQPAVLFSPGNGATNVGFPPTLRWRAWGIYGYELQVSSNPSFSPSIVDQFLYDTSYTVYGLAGYTTYYWRVMAKCKPNDTPWSDIWTFTTGAAPVCTQVLPPSWVSATSNLTGRIVVTWGQGYATCGIAGYKVYRRDYCGTTWWLMACPKADVLGFIDYIWRNNPCGNMFVYRITTVDISLNESLPSPEAIGQSY